MLKLSAVALAAIMSVGPAGNCFARPVRHHRVLHRYYTFQQGNSGVEAATGTVFGLIGAGIAGASTVTVPYPQGDGFYDRGDYGPRY